MIRELALSDTSTAYDVVIVGAGPAGMSAASELSALGIKALVIDDQPSPGGQIYRNITSSPIPAQTVLGKDYWRGRELVDRFTASNADYLPSSSVWQIEERAEGLRLYLSRDNRSRRVDTRFAILATGAIERPFPIAGWTSPGVIGVGAAQVLLKSSGLLPSGRTVLLGEGPLLWLYASQMIEAGHTPAHILSTAESALPPLSRGGLADFILSRYALKGAALVAKVRRATRYSRVTKPRIEQGADGLVVRYSTAGGSEAEIAADTVLVHQGVVPNLNLARAANCDIAWNEVHACWQPRTDQWGTSSLARVSVAGDAAGISGAEAAAVLGRISALNTAHALGRISEAKRDQMAAAGFAFVERNRKARHLLDRMYRPSDAMRAGDDDAIICRCEEVTGGQLRAVLRETQAQGPNQVKAYLRCGMGPCQGRYCNLTVDEIIAQEHQLPRDAVAPIRIRPPVKPVSLGELASLQDQD